MKLFQDLFFGHITIWQAILAIFHWLSPRRRSTGDDFDWKYYSHHYRQELKSIERKQRLILETADFEVLAPGQLRLLKADVLLPSHHSLYESLLLLRPSSALEVGFGGGDHLANISTLMPELDLSGIDRSSDQLRLAESRHPNLRGKLSVHDLTSANVSIKRADVVFSHAVLMHISEKEGRFDRAIRNTVRSARKAVVFVENWTQHDFQAATLAGLKDEGKDDWGLYLYESSMHGGAYSLIASAHELSLPRLRSYDVLLDGAPLRPH